mmetsp:Transcript_78369/g.159318  ORF Transcript_78369/g.159318 Transcript_78369/m.159318 type:complete len:80 (-) Transcript_78369:372-611(-)
MATDGIAIREYDLSPFQLKASRDSQMRHQPIQLGVGWNSVMYPASRKNDTADLTEKAIPMATRGSMDKPHSSSKTHMAQ